MYLSGSACFWSLAASPSAGAAGFAPFAGYASTSTPSSATEDSSARFGMFAARRSVSVAKRNEVLARRVAMRPLNPISSFSPDGVQRTTEPSRVIQQAVAAIRCSASVVTKMTSASQRRKIFFSRRAAE